MPKSPFRPLLRPLACVFVAATALYSGLWMSAVRRAPSAHLGISYVGHADSGSIGVARVAAGSPAAAAGLRGGDRIMAVDGHSLLTTVPLDQAIRLGQPGRQIRLTVLREGEPEPLTLTARLEPPPAPGPTSPTRWLATELLNEYPLFFVLVGGAVLLLRMEDRNAWLLALLFGGLIAGAPILPFEGAIPQALTGFALAYKVVFNALCPGLFLFFFAVFPASSALDRRAPWLKWAWLAAGGTAGLALASQVLAEGSSRPLHHLSARFRDTGLPLVIAHALGGFGLGFASLLWNALRGTPEARRKSRVIVIGTAAGLGPILVLQVAAAVLHRSYNEFPFWVWASAIAALGLMPLSFAYAVVRHRVLEIPALIRLSARYLLVQRGFLGLLLLLGIGSTSLFASSVARQLQAHTRSPVAVAIALGTAFGIVLVWSGTALHRRLRGRIDRAFFRSAYDARQIFEDLAERARSATSREELAATLVHHVRAALLPRTLAVYLEFEEHVLRLAGGDAAATHKLPAGLPFLAELTLRGGSRVLPQQEEAGAVPIPALAPLSPECLVPIRGRESLLGLLVLGPRLSEEPYSGEDRRLLDSVAGQAGVSLENIRLAERMAERLESERRNAHELELAQAVQRRLLAQDTPPMQTLDYAGRCLQARAVGGDYYDFLDLGTGRLGLVLADISGKGFSAALLMANLQASLRSRSAEDMLDLPRQLRSVNQLLFRSSDLSRYATLFLGIYEDAERKLRYVVCGHNPPLLLRMDGTVERLQPTAPVLGLFEEWDCAVGEVRLGAGDLIAIYTDGVTEAFSDAGEEFGEARLIDVLRGRPAETTPDLVEAVVAAVGRFSGSEQEDDLTLVVARSR